jgi:hypothetical protein
MIDIIEVIDIVKVKKTVHATEVPDRLPHICCEDIIKAIMYIIKIIRLS